MAKIMLVEDDNNLRQIYEDRLAAEGYEIVSAPDGEEALAMAVKERPDLIIADVMMPKVSGFDMLDILRSTPETKDCKIIMMTALSQAEDKARAEKLGADRYLVKSQVTLEDVAKIAGDILNGDSATPAETTADSPTTAPAAPATPAPTSASIPVSAPPEPTTAPVPEPAAAPVVPATEPVAVPVIPAPEPAPAPVVVTPPTEPSAPTTPTTTSIPVTSANDDDDKTSQEAALEATALAAANLAAPIGTEKAEAKGKIDEFIASNPTLSGSAETPPATTPEPVAEPTPAPAAKIEVKTEESTPAEEAKPAEPIVVTEAPAEPTPANVTIVTEPAPAQTSEPTSVAVPAPTTTPAEEAASKKVADAVDGLLKETESTPTDTKDAAEAEKPQGYVADGGNTESQSMIHTKRIEPIADGSIPTPPDINELLAREGEIGSAQPPISSVISPGTGGSVNAATVDNTPQVNVLAEEKGNEPPTPAQPATAPNSDITL